MGMVSETMATMAKIDNSVVASYLKASLIQDIPNFHMENMKAVSLRQVSLAWKKFAVSCQTNSNKSNNKYLS